MEADLYLKDKTFDRMHHALGRPVDPLGETYRNFLAAGLDYKEINDMIDTGHWCDHGRFGLVRLLSVTDAGRQALKGHLDELGAQS